MINLHVNHVFSRYFSGLLVFRPETAWRQEGYRQTPYQL